MESVDSMIAIVQIYINIKKNVQVNIKVTNFVEVRKLKQAYQIAKDFLNYYNMQIIERNF